MQGNENEISTEFISENEISSEFISENKKITADFSKKQIITILIIIIFFFSIISLIIYAFFSSKHSQTNLKDSKTNYIKAIYDCPGKNETCQFYTRESIFKNLISSITIDGKNVPVTTYSLKYENPCKKNLIFYFKEKATNMEKFFKYSNLISVDFSHFDTSELTNMREMFNSCFTLHSITWGRYFSTSKVTDMSELFSNCRELEYVDLS